jgi:hypothetical protein
MVEEQRTSIDQAEVLRAEIDVLRGAVAALRSTRASAVARARDDAHVIAARAKIMTTLIGFVAGVALTAGALAVYGAAICP